MVVLKVSKSQSLKLYLLLESVPVEYLLLTMNEDARLWQPVCNVHGYSVYRSLWGGSSPLWTEASWASRQRCLLPNYIHRAPASYSEFSSKELIFVSKA